MLRIYRVIAILLTLCICTGCATALQNLQGVNVGGKNVCVGEATLKQNGQKILVAANPQNSQPLVETDPQGRKYYLTPQNGQLVLIPEELVKIPVDFDGGTVIGIASIGLAVGTAIWAASR